MIVNYDSRVIPDLKIPHITTLEPLFTIARPLKDWPHVYHRYFLLFITAIPEYKCSKNCRQVDSNCNPLASEAADLPAVPKQLPYNDFRKTVEFNFRRYFKRPKTYTHKRGTQDTFYFSPNPASFSVETIHDVSKEHCNFYNIRFIQLVSWELNSRSRIPYILTW